MTLEAFCAEHSIDRIDLVKMDIEGAELDVFDTISSLLLQRIVQMTVDFHDFLQPADIPRIEAVIRRLRREGFWTLNGLCTPMAACCSLTSG